MSNSENTGTAPRTMPGMAADAPESTTQPNADQAPHTLEQELEALRTDLESAQTKAVEQYDAFLRAKAEMENIRRRAQEDIAKAHKFGIEKFAEALVPVKDSLEAALNVQAATLESYKEGIEITLRQLVSAFEKNALVEIDPIGQKFDPHKHQAIAMVPADAEPNTVVAVMQKGYAIADRVLRPALVSVAQAK